MRQNSFLKIQQSSQITQSSQRIGKHLVKISSSQPTSVMERLLKKVKIGMFFRAWPWYCPSILFFEFFLIRFLLPNLDRVKTWQNIFCLSRYELPRKIVCLYIQGLAVGLGLDIFGQKTGFSLPHLLRPQYFVEQNGIGEYGIDFHRFWDSEQFRSALKKKMAFDFLSDLLISRSYPVECLSNSLRAIFYV